MYMLKSVGDRTPPCGTLFLNWLCVDVLPLNVVYALRPTMLSAMYLTMVCGMPVWFSLCVSVCMLTVSNAPLTSSATAIVRPGCLPWLTPVAMMLSMLCSRVGMCGMLFVMHGSSVISSVFAITERSEVALELVCS